MGLTLKNKKITTIGGSVGFIIDKAYIKNGLISKDKIYDITIEETLLKHEKPMEKVKPKIPEERKE